MKTIKNLLPRFGQEQSQLDKKMHRRSFQKQLDKVEMPHHYTGFTNRILIQQLDHKTINYFIPAYVIFKIKSIQDIDIQKLVGSISCVIIISVRIQHLSEQIINLLQTSMNIQLNRSEVVQLRESEQNNITVSKKDKMLTFTLRKTVTGTIVQQTLWSPFQIIRLIVSVTFNSIKKDGQDIMHAYLQRQSKQNEEKKHRLETIVKELGTALKESEKKQKPKEKFEFDSLKKYVIMFNSMRCGAQIPISYALGCVYSIYDLAERKLQSYHTHLDSYNQIIRNYQESLEDKKGDKKKKQSKTNTDSKKEEKQFSVKKQTLPAQPANIEVQEEHKNNLDQYFSQIYKQQAESQVEKDVKPKYYQYTHIVIPLYKYPGNSLATIFTPIFLLALLSLAIFYQDNQLSSRIGSIATLVLGYIALIPSIKEQLPPSSKITIIEGVVYLSTLCCLLSLIESFRVDGIQGYVFNWSQNTLFLLCLCIHSAIFMFVLFLLAIHKMIWQKSYNYDEAVKSPDPEKESHKWINIYCDQEFFKTNNKIYSNNLKNPKQEKKARNLIKKYVAKTKVVQQKPTEDSLLKMLGAIAQKPKEQKPVNSLTDSTIKSETSTLITQSKLTQRTEKSEEVQKTKKKSKEKVEKKSKDQKDKGDKKKDPLKYQKSLQYLDELINSGYHITLYKQKQVQKKESAKDQNLSQKKNQ